MPCQKSVRRKSSWPRFRRIAGTRSRPGGVVEFNQSIPKIVADFKAKGKDVSFVDQLTPLDADPDSMADSLHPNAKGNAIMAKQWFDAIEKAR